MYIDRETVINMLDKSIKEYDGNLIAVNTLPQDAIFEINIEDIVTAEFYDCIKDEMFIFKLDHEYFSPTSSISELETGRLEKYVASSFSTNDEYGTKDIKVNKIFKYTRITVFILFIVMVVITILLFYNIYKLK